MVQCIHSNLLRLFKCILLGLLQMYKNVQHARFTGRLKHDLCFICCLMARRSIFALLNQHAYAHTFPFFLRGILCLAFNLEFTVHSMFILTAVVIHISTGETAVPRIPQLLKTQDKSFYAKSRFQPSFFSSAFHCSCVCLPIYSKRVICHADFYTSG